MKETLKNIEFDINKGLKFRSAERLRNLINSKPNEIELWNRLAELYYESGFLDAAGKYWILTEPSDERIAKCVEIYEKSVNHSGHQILREIKFRGDKSQLSEYANKKLSELESDSKIKTGFVPKIENKFQKPKVPITEYKRTFEDKMADFWAYFIIGFLAVLVLIGVYTVIKWAFF